VLFLVFKRQLYGQFRDAFQVHRPIFELVNINYYHCPVTGFGNI